MDLAGSEAAPRGDVIMDGLGRVGGRGESGQVEGSTQKEGEEVEMVEKKTGAAGEKKTTG